MRVLTESLDETLRTHAFSAHTSVNLDMSCAVAVHIVYNDYAVFYSDITTNYNTAELY